MRYQDWLAHYQPSYTLPAFPWFINQTVGGAIATATHGSSLRYGSMSNQVRLRERPACPPEIAHASFLCLCIFSVSAQFNLTN